MSARRDDPREDYDDGPPTPESTAGQRAANRASVSAPKLAVGVRVICGAFLVLGISAMLMDQSPRAPAKRLASANNLKQIGLAIHGYHDSWGQLPHNTYAPGGKPLLSWRVHILPYIEQEALFNQFDLDEPWDGPNNIRLLNQMPRTYARPADAARPGTLTHYRGFSSPGAVFEFRPSHVQARRIPVFGRWRDPRPGLGMASIGDGAENTILVVEAGDRVEWTKPEDLDCSPGRSFPKMGGMGWRKVFQAVMADGSVRGLRLDLPDETLRALVTHSGGESLTPGWNDNP